MCNKCFIVFYCTLNYTIMLDNIGICGTQNINVSQGWKNQDLFEKKIENIDLID